MSNNFTTISTKKLNLILADQLQNLPYSSDKIYTNIISSLRFCIKYSILEKDQSNTYNIFTNSLTCKNKYCFYCNHIKSLKYTNRFMNFMCLPANEILFKNKYFYFITLTLKHDINTRNYVYLKDLTKYQNKLFRSKIWAQNFGSKDKKNTNSFIASSEITFTKNNYNIHTHILVISDKLKVKINEFQNELQATWLKITNDSWNARIDLIKNDKSKDFQNTLKEVFKYNVKLQLKNITDKETIYKLGDWIEKSHNQKLIKVHGFLRGFNLFARQSIYDKVVKTKYVDDTNKYFICNTSKLLFDKNVSFMKSLKSQNIDLNSLKLVPHMSNVIDISTSIDNVIYNLKTDKFFNKSKLTDILNVPDPVINTKTKIENEINNDKIFVKILSSVKVDFNNSIF